MSLTPAACHRALRARDRRFDGVFFVGVRTTGVYCRPICPAPTAKPANCEFFGSAAAAEREGYRPCLRCRPELAPGLAQVDAPWRLATAAAARIEAGGMNGGGVEALARSLGVTSRHLRRVVQDELGVTPIEMAQTQRMLMAKRLLTDTALPVARVAHASGFRSVRRMNALFRERYRLRPGDLRQRRMLEEPVVSCDLVYRPPLDWEFLLGFLGARAIAGVEAVDGGRYLRTVALHGKRGWISVEPAPDRFALRVRVPLALTPALPAILGRVKRQFDLAADPVRIAARLRGLPARGLRVPGSFDAFEVVVRAVLGQQVSVRAAQTLAGRFASTFGGALETPHAALTRTWPDPASIAGLKSCRIASIGLPETRARTISALARALADGRIDLEPGADVEATKAALQEIPGIGEWTAEYVAMRGLGWPDAFPRSDLGVLKALRTDDPRVAERRAEAWRPWRAYAVMALWRSHS